MLIFRIIWQNKFFCYFHFIINFLTCKDQMFLTINFNFISFIYSQKGSNQVLFTAALSSFNF